MTLIRPIDGAPVLRALGSLSMKAALTAVIGLTAWHYTDAGDIKSLRQHSTDQEKRLDLQGDAIAQKIDRDTYHQDQRQLYEEIHDIRVSEDQIKQLLMQERQH